MSLVTSHWPNGSHRLGHPTGAHHWGMFGHFSRVHGWLCTAPDPLEGTVLGSQLLTHRWPWYAMVIIWVSPKNFLKSIEIRWTQGVCALHRLTGTGLPGPLADSVGGTSPGLCTAWWPAPAQFSLAHHITKYQWIHEMLEPQLPSEKPGNWGWNLKYQGNWPPGRLRKLIVPSNLGLV